MGDQFEIEGPVYAGATPGTETVVNQARRLEELGFDRAYTPETSRDPFHPLVLAAHVTERLELATGIAVAFARTPMTIAAAAQDVNVLSRGRFRLGLGSQIKPHIERRFGMPWYGAAKQMREFVLAIKAIFDTWYDGVPLNFEGEFYQHTLMTPEFTPVTEGIRRPPIMLAAVGPLMIRTAAEVADGLIIHPFCTETYLRDHILPILEPALAERGRSLEDFQIQYPVFIATGTTEEQLEASKAAVRQRVGFYGSTPAYRPVLEAHGWGDLQPHLRQMTKEGRWNELAGEITDEVLETFAVVGEPVAAAHEVRKRFGGLVDSVVLDSSASDDLLLAQMEVLRSPSP